MSTAEQLATTPFVFPCTDPTCAEQVRVHRPYAKARGANYLPSISAFCDAIAGGGDGLVHYGAGEGATVAYWMQGKDDTPTDLDEYVGKVRRTVAAMRKTDADLGVAAHLAPEAWATGGAWTEPADLYEWDRERLWNFVGGIGRWWEQRAPEVLCCEFIVADDAYVGTGDMLAVVGGKVTYIDWKTHRRYKKDEKSSYEKWWLQGQMIANAHSLRHYHANQLVTQVEWETTGLPRPEQIMVVSIAPGGEVREYRWPVVSRDVLAPTVASLATAVAFKAPTPLQAVIPKYAPRPDAPVSLEAML